MDVEFEVGQRVTRGPNGESGFIHAVEKRRLLMVEVRWEATGSKQWLPAEQVCLWDKLSEPVKAPTSKPKKRDDEWWKLNAELHKARREYFQNKKVLGRYGDYIYSLDEEKNRSKMKVEKICSKLERMVKNGASNRS